MARTFIVAVLALALAALPAAAQCYSQCRFKLCHDGTNFFAPKADEAFTGAICAKTGMYSIGIIGQTGEAQLVGTKHGYTSMTPISEWLPLGLEKNFSPSFFKTFTRFIKVGTNFRSLGNSGIGRESFQENQKEYINGRCFILPLTQWQELNKDGTVRSNVLGHSPLDCVAFKAYA